MFDVTSKVTIQVAPLGKLTPDNITVFPAELTLPPTHVVVGIPTKSKLDGSVSIKLTPIRVTVFELESVMITVDLSPDLIVGGVKIFVESGGPTTVSVA